MDHVMRGSGGPGQLNEKMIAIGTRGSPLALAQAKLTALALSSMTGRELTHYPQVIIQTSGDRIQDRSLADAGGKGLFTKEIDEAQLRGEIAIAVHSAKDLPTRLPDGLHVAGYLKRADVRDAFISKAHIRLADLPAGARIGTASLRRRAQVLHLRADLKVDLIRGNVETRIKKVETGEYAATLLALAGLQRLGLEHHATEVLDVESFLPAVAQGAIALVTRIDDPATNELVRLVNDRVTFLAVEAERAFLHELDGSCRTPIAGHATLDYASRDYASLEQGILTFRARVMSPDGLRAIADHCSGPLAGSKDRCRELGKRIRAKLPDDFFEEKG